MPARSAGQRPVINATGVVLYTNLGRAPLSATAVDALVAAAGHTDVELDRNTGRRIPCGAAPSKVHRWSGGRSAGARP